jgi:hypothetical protein
MVEEQLPPCLACLLLGLLLVLLLSLFHLLSLSEGMSIFKAGFKGLPERVRCKPAALGGRAGQTLNSVLNLTDGCCCCCCSMPACTLLLLPAAAKSAEPAPAPPAPAG